MSLLRIFACLVPMALVACGGATSSGDGSPGSETGRDAPGSASDATSRAEPAVPDKPVVFNPATTTPHFYVGIVEARRVPALAQCGEKEAPFSDGDRFSLQLVGSFSTGPARFKSVALDFNRRVDDGARRSGDVRGLDASGHQNADLDGIRLTLLADESNPVQPAGVVTSASVSVLTFPKQEGARLSARVELRFADGAVFDATITAKVKSSEGSCGEPRG